MGNLIAGTFNIPASSGEYARYLAGHFGIAQNAAAAIVGPDDYCTENPDICAQCELDPDSCPLNSKSSGLSFATGNGFNSLIPVLDLWTAMRNFVYLFFVILFIVIGLGIMFRIQIDPRAVLSIQSQLPKIVIALVLVTFSYAIAGFLIDMMYVSLFLIINIFQGQDLQASTTLATSPFNAIGGFGGIHGISFDAAKGVAGVLSSIFEGNIWGETIKTFINVIFGVFSGGGLVGGGIGAGIGAAVAGPIGLVVGGLAGGAIGGIGTQLGLIPGPDPFAIVTGAIAYLIIAIAIITALFRLWFILLKTYVFILINIIFAPFWIGMGLLPGSSLSFGSWLRAVVSDLSAFPLVLILFSLGKTLQDGFSGSSGANQFVPPYIGNPGDISAIGSLIGLGIILLAPEAVNITKSALKAPEFKYASAVGRSLGAGAGFISKPVGGLWGSLTGEDIRGNPRPLARLAQDKFGSLAGILLGASFKNKRFDESQDDEGNLKTKVTKLPLFRLPGIRGLGRRNRKSPGGGGGGTGDSAGSDAGGGGGPTVNPPAPGGGVAPFTDNPDDKRDESREEDQADPINALRGDVRDVKKGTGKIDETTGKILSELQKDDEKKPDIGDGDQNTT